MDLTRKTNLDGFRGMSIKSEEGFFFRFI